MKKCQIAPSLLTPIDIVKSENLCYNNIYIYIKISDSGGKRMLELRLEDIDVRNVLFTLDILAKEFEIEKCVARRLLTSMQMSLSGRITPKSQFLEFIKYEAIQETGKSSMSDFINAGLITPSDEVITEETEFFLTEKALAFLRAVAEKQRTMKELGLAYCGGFFVSNPTPLYSNIRECP